MQHALLCSPGAASTGRYISTERGIATVDVWSILEHGGGKTMAVSREDVLNKLTALAKERGPWYIERLHVSDSDGNRYLPEVSEDGTVALVLRSGPTRKRR
jgi:hypothetical protein